MQIAPSECVATMHKKDSGYGYSFLFKDYNKKIANLCRLTTWSLVGLKQDSKKSSDYLEALNLFILRREQGFKKSSDCLEALNLFILRREQDSNLRTGFAGYTLSRRASSATRAPLL